MLCYLRWEVCESVFHRPKVFRASRSCGLPYPLSEVHHETQPLPTPLAPFLHALPLPAHKAATAAGLLLELGVGPLAFVEGFGLRGAAALCFLSIAAIQAAIAISGARTRTIEMAAWP